PEQFGVGNGGGGIAAGLGLGCPDLGQAVARVRGSWQRGLRGSAAGSSDLDRRWAAFCVVVPLPQRDYQPEGLSPFEDGPASIVRVGSTCWVGIPVAVCGR